MVEGCFRAGKVMAADSNTTEPGGNYYSSIRDDWKNLLSFDLQKRLAQEDPSAITPN